MLVRYRAALILLKLASYARLVAELDRINVSKTHCCIPSCMKQWVFIDVVDFLYTVSLRDLVASYRSWDAIAIVHICKKDRPVLFAEPKFPKQDVPYVPYVPYIPYGCYAPTVAFQPEVPK